LFFHVKTIFGLFAAFDFVRFSRTENGGPDQIIPIDRSSLLTSSFQPSAVGNQNKFGADLGFWLLENQ
jgi:hypothetical protein